MCFAGNKRKECGALLHGTGVNLFTMTALPGPGYEQLCVKFIKKYLSIKFMDYIYPIK
jgi:hypothetical protein